MQDFISSFDQEEEVLNEYFKRMDIVLPISNTKRQVVKRYLKASIAQNLFDDNGFYKAIQANDKMIEKVFFLDSINDGHSN